MVCGDTFTAFAISFCESDELLILSRNRFCIISKVIFLFLLIRCL